VDNWKPWIDEIKNNKFYALGLLILLVLPLMLFTMYQIQNTTSRAALPDQLESESGVLSSSGVTKQSDSRASGGQYIRFSKSSTNPSSTPTSTPLPSGTYYYPPAPSGSDDTGALNSFLNNLPSGTATKPSIVLFDPAHTYTLSANDTRLHLRNKAYIYIYGMDPASATGAVNETTPRATINLRSAYDYNSVWAIGNNFGPSNNIKIIGFRLHGDWTTNFRTLNQHISATQSRHGFGLYASGGQHHVEIAYNVIEYFSGHAIYVRTNDGDVSWDHVNIHHNVVRGMGTMGIVVSNGRNIYVDDNKIYDTAMYPIIAEDAGSGEAVNDWYIRRNVIQDWGWTDLFPGAFAIAFSPNFGATFNRVLIADNILQGDYHSPYAVSSDHHYGLISFGQNVAASDITVTGNVSTVPKDGVQVQLENTAGVIITDNSFTGSFLPKDRGSDNPDYVLSSPGCTNITESGNTIGY
jgi:hypothetical protein